MAADERSPALELRALIESVGDEQQRVGRPQLGQRDALELHALAGQRAVDEEGRIRIAQYNVKATGHVAKLRRDLGLDP